MEGLIEPRADTGVLTETTWHLQQGLAASSASKQLRHGARLAGFAMARRAAHAPMFDFAAATPLPTHLMFAGRALMKDMLAQPLPSTTTRGRPVFAERGVW